MVIYKRANNMVKVSNKQTMGSFGASNINKKRIEIFYQLGWNHGKINY